MRSDPSSTGSRCNPIKKAANKEENVLFLQDSIELRRHRRILSCLSTSETAAGAVRGNFLSKYVSQIKELSTEMIGTHLITFWIE